MVCKGYGGRVIENREERPAGIRLTKMVPVGTAKYKMWIRV